MGKQVTGGRNPNESFTQAARTNEDDAVDRNEQRDQLHQAADEQKRAQATAGITPEANVTGIAPENLPTPTDSLIIDEEAEKARAAATAAAQPAEKQDTVAVLCLQDIHTFGQLHTRGNTYMMNRADAELAPQFFEVIGSANDVEIATTTEYNLARIIIATVRRPEVQALEPIAAEQFTKKHVATLLALFDNV